MKFSNSAAKALIQHLFLDEQWLPEQIENRLRKENNPIQLPSEFLNDISRDLLRCSRANPTFQRTARHGQKVEASRQKLVTKKGEQETRRKIRISNPIEQRPKEANSRSMIGHWESDTAARKTGSSCLITLTDRHSRYLLAKKVTKKTAAFVRDGMIELPQSISSEYVLSVTLDRGKEFSFHEQVTDAMKGMPFYFPKPPCTMGTRHE